MVDPPGIPSRPRDEEALRTAPSLWGYLLRAHDALGSGRYVPGKWTVSLPRGLSEEQRRLPSLHESMHSAITDSTAFGSALHAYFWLSRFASDSDRYGKVLVDLVRASRRIQEYFATYAGVQILSGSDPAVLLADYPDYAEHYAFAARLVALPGFRLPDRGLRMVARVCMQSEILEAVLERGVDNFGGADLRIALQPDYRLTRLRPVLSSGFWQQLLASWEQTRPTGWDEIVALNADPDRHPELLTGDYPTTLRSFNVFVYEQLRSALEHHAGLRSLSFDGHLDVTRALRDAADQLVPDAPYRLYLDADEPVPEREEALRAFGNEQTVLRSTPSPANGYIIDVADRSTLDNLLSSRGTRDSHFFFVIRTKASLEANYLLTDTVRDWLRAQNDEYVVALRTYEMGASGEAMVSLGCLGGLTRIKRLRTLPVGSRGLLRRRPHLIGNIPMSILRLPEFDASLDQISSGAGLSMLFDLPPLDQFHKWREGPHRIRYAGMTVEAPCPIEHVFVFEHGAMPGVPFIAPCSEQMLQLLLNFAAEEGETHGFLRLDESLVRVHEKTLIPTISHLAHEEPVFTFQGSLE